MRIKTLYRTTQQGTVLYHNVPAKVSEVCQIISGSRGNVRE